MAINVAHACILYLLSSPAVRKQLQSFPSKADSQIKCVNLLKLRKEQLLIGFDLQMLGCPPRLALIRFSLLFG